MVDSALVLGGGIGSRLGKGTKSMITLDGRPLIDFVFRELQEARVVNVVVLTRSEYRENISRIAEGWRFDKLEILVSDRINATTLVPYLLRDFLATRAFFVVVGHTPSPSEHLSRMRSIHEEHGGASRNLILSKRN